MVLDRGIVDCGLMKGENRKVQGIGRYGSLGFVVIGPLPCAVIGHTNEMADDRQQTTDFGFLISNFEIRIFNPMPFALCSMLAGFWLLYSLIADWELGIGVEAVI
ncbi:MAG: hypothetical protein P8075_03285 [Deltaproteobacteria bacterium]|jgi:mannitol-specific phosphotransferase system IIBC component